MKKIKIGGGGVDQNGEWYSYENEIEMTDEEYAEWHAALQAMLVAPRELSNLMIVSSELRQAFIEAAGGDDPL